MTRGHDLITSSPDAKQTNAELCGFAMELSFLRSSLLGEINSVPQRRLFFHRAQRLFELKYEIFFSC
jgi:hypothetical protein